MVPDAQPSNLPKWLQRISGVAAVIGVLPRISRLISIRVCTLYDWRLYTINPIYGIVLVCYMETSQRQF